MLTVNGINVYYGAIHAIKDVSFHVGDGEIVTLIGANGAGKTTILHTISGLLRSKTGEIKFLDNPINKIEPHKILKMGIAHVPEGRRIFSQMTVLENLQMGAYTRTNKEENNDMIEMVFEKFPRLKERINQLAGTMSGGEQQMLAIGRALMSKPKLLLMDEPSMGLAPILVQEIFNIIQEINLPELLFYLLNKMQIWLLSIANRAYVLETGKVVLDGNAKELLGNENVKRLI